VIEALMQHASQEKYTFKVDWENTGDMIIWVRNIELSGPLEQHLMLISAG
jgi:hypothetical protein